MTTFETVAQMKLAHLRAAQWVQTKGYNTAGDGGGADYLTAGSQAVDGYGDHLLAGGTVALLQTNIVVNVKDYGAEGDGVADDTAAIQAAYTFVRLAGGGSVRYPAGVYLVTESIVVGSNTRTAGCGWASSIKAHQTLFTGTNAGGNCYLLKNYNHGVAALTDENLIVEDIVLDYGAVTIVGGGAHAISFRYVDRVTIHNVIGIRGENVTALLACKDTVTDSCHGVDQINAYFDHWDGAGNCKVINCTGRTQYNIAQGIQFTGTSSALGARSSLDAVVAFNSIYNVKGATGSSTAIISNANAAGASSYRFKSFGNYVEDSDIGLAFAGEGGQHLSMGDTFKDVLQLPIFMQHDGTDAPNDCRVIDPHLIDCDHATGNVALVSMAGDDNAVRGLRITNSGAALYNLVTWFTSNANDCLVELEKGPAGAGGTVQNNGTGCTFIRERQEGSWTPVLTFATPGDVAVTYAAQLGSYVIEGNRLTIHFNLLTSAFTHTTAAGEVRIAGLPLAAINIVGQQNVGSLEWGGITKGGYTAAVANVHENQSHINVEMCGSGVSPTIITSAEMPTGGQVALRGKVEVII